MQVPPAPPQKGLQQIMEGNWAGTLHVLTQHAALTTDKDPADVEPDSAICLAVPDSIGMLTDSGRVMSALTHCHSLAKIQRSRKSQYSCAVLGLVQVQTIRHSTCSRSFCKPPAVRIQRAFVLILKQAHGSIVKWLKSYI